MEWPRVRSPGGVDKLTSSGHDRTLTHTAAEATSTGSNQSTPSHEGEKASALTEGSLTFNGCRGRENHPFLMSVAAVGSLALVDGIMPMHIRTALIGALGCFFVIVLLLLLLLLLLF